MIEKKYKLRRLNEPVIQKPVVDESRFVINYSNELNAAQFEAASALDGRINLNDNRPCWDFEK